MTLAVRLGRQQTRSLYSLLIVAAFVAVPIALVTANGPAWGLLALLAAPLARRPIRAVMTRTDGPSLNGALAGTGALLAAFSVLLATGLVIAA